MNLLKLTVTTTTALCLITLSGCAATYGPGASGAPLDDQGITTAIQQRYAKHQQVDATAIGVQTQDGSVVISGLARNATEKTAAERIAWRINGVKSVKNNITIRP